MSGRICLRQAVIVEGKYDKIRLESVVDALIIPTGGFGIFRDRELRALIAELARTQGIIILTDSDTAGFRIRSFLKGMIPANQILHVYIPDIAGKERRKAAPSAEGKLGVEGMDPKILWDALLQAGAEPTDSPPLENRLTKTDLYECGLTGGPDSRKLRTLLFRKLSLPERMSANAALPILSRMMTREELFESVRDMSC